MMSHIVKLNQIYIEIKRDIDYIILYLMLRYNEE